MATEIATRPKQRALTPPSGHEALVASGVVKAFRTGKETRRAVDGVSLRVGRGEIYALLGANGSGKSTLIRVFSTLLIPGAGEVPVFGLDVQADGRALKRLLNPG